MQKIKPENCSHEHIQRNGKSNGKQRYICSDCGARVWELSEINKKVIKENLDILLSIKGEIIRDDLVYRVSKDEDNIDYPFKYHIKPNVLNWGTFLKYKRGKKLKGDILMYFLDSDIATETTLNVVKVIL